MSHRWKMLVVIAVVLLVFVGICAVSLHYQPENEVEAYKQALLAKGEKLEIAQVAPPTVPPEDNGADTVRAAFALFTAGGSDYTNQPVMMRIVAPGKAIVGWAQPDVRSYYTNTWDNVIVAVEANRPATELLGQVVYFPAIDFQLDYSKGPETPVQHLWPLKSGAQKLSAAAMCDLRAGATASAATNLCTLLALVQETHEERMLLSQLVRMAIASIATSATWEWLQATNATDAELATLQRSWERLEFIEAVENSFLMERAAMESTIQKMRASNQNFNRFAGISGSAISSGPGGSADWLDDLRDIWNDTKIAGARFMWRTSWTYSDELQALRGDQIVLESLRTIQTNQFFNPAYTNILNQFEAMGISNNPDEWFLKLDIPDFRRIFSDENGTWSAVVRRTMSVETSRRVVITAIALKRFQQERGNFPEKLSELTPEFLATTPLDPVDGQLLRYRRNADGTFLLYSIGENGKDDGGNPSLGTGVTATTLYWQSPHTLDWVWPQPATPEEIRSFYEHPPK